MTLIPVTCIGQQIILFRPAKVMITHSCIQWFKLLSLTMYENNFRIGY